MQLSNGSRKVIFAGIIIHVFTVYSDLGYWVWGKCDSADAHARRLSGHYSHMPQVPKFYELAHLISQYETSVYWCLLNTYFCKQWPQYVTFHQGLHCWGLYRGAKYPISLEVNKQASIIHVLKLVNIPIINFPKYSISLKVTKILNTVSHIPGSKLNSNVSYIPESKMANIRYPLNSYTSLRKKWYTEKDFFVIYTVRNAHGMHATLNKHSIYINNR